VRGNENLSFDKVFLVFSVLMLSAFTLRKESICMASILALHLVNVGMILDYFLSDLGMIFECLE